MSRKRSRSDTRRAHLEELERRILLSADFESALLDPSLADGVDPNDPLAREALPEPPDRWIERRKTAQQREIERERERRA